MSDDSMNRRRFLAVTGTATTLALAGCAGGSDTETDAGGATDTMTETMTERMTETMTEAETETMTETAPTTFTVTIENRSTGSTLQTPEGSAPVPLSPGAYAAHTTDIQLFTPGQPASDGIEGIAEDGTPGTLAETLGGADAVVDGGAFNTPDGAGSPGPLTPGNTYSFEVAAPADADPRLSFATMFIQSNDLFYAPADAAGIPLFEDGSPIDREVTADLGLWDAGTEVNERPGTGPNQAPRQSGPDTGTPEGVVREVNDAYDYPETSEVVGLTLSVDSRSGSGATWTVTVENRSTGSTLQTPEGSVPVPLSPGAYAAHTTAIQLFTPGQPASEGIENIAEDGMPGTLAETLGGADAVVDGGAFNTPDGAGSPGPLTPGNTYSFQVSAESGADPRLSLATMFIQSNDLFYAPADAAGIPLFEDGSPVEGDVTGMLRLWDAGTEVNERPGTGPNQAPRQSGPDTGTPEGVVRPVSDGYDYPETSEVLSVTVSPN
jgi:hypothetical protein